MYGYTLYKERTSTPPRSPRPSTSVAQTSTWSCPANENPKSITYYTAMSQEYASLRYPGHCPFGICLIPDKGNALIWDGVFFGSSVTRPHDHQKELAFPPFRHAVVPTYAYSDRSPSTIGVKTTQSERLLLRLDPKIPSRISNKLTPHHEPNPQ